MGSRFFKRVTSKVKAGLKKKLVFLRKQREEIQRTQVKKRKLDTKVVYNNSSRHLTDEQIELLSLGLNFGIAPKKFPLLEYVTAAEVLCQRLEEVGDAESIEKARYVRNEVFLHLKRSYKMKIKSNLTPDQRRVLKEFKEDDTIIICPADKGKAVVVEDREAYMAKTQDQIHEGDYVLSNKSEKTILQRLHRNLMGQIVAMNITDFKEQRRFAVTGPVMASIALLVKVHKKNFQVGLACLRLMTRPIRYARSSLTY